jgi:hypothetical protein
MKIKALASCAAAAIVTSSVLVAGPAQAAPSACNSGQGCTYEDANYGRGHINFSFNVPHYGNVSYWVPTLHVLTNDSASSAFHNGKSTQLVKLFDRENYRGAPKLTLARGKGSTNLTAWGFNDRLTSACFANYCH